MNRNELIDTVITSHWDDDRRNAPELSRIDDPRYQYLVGKDERNEGYFIIWDGEESVEPLNTETYGIILQEASIANIHPPYNVYARYELYQSRNVNFFKISSRHPLHD
jgi:adenine-specific DNA-methyltransferase